MSDPKVFWCSLEDFDEFEQALAPTARFIYNAVFDQGIEHLKISPTSLLAPHDTQRSELSTEDRKFINDVIAKSLTPEQQFFRVNFLPLTVKPNE